MSLKHKLFSILYLTLCIPLLCVFGEQGPSVRIIGSVSNSNFVIFDNNRTLKDSNIPMSSITTLLNDYYYVPPSVSFTTGGATFELGLVMINVDISFTCNKHMESRIYSLGYVEDLGSGQNNTFIDTNGVTSTTSFRITVEDDRGNTDTATKSYIFNNRKYTGASTNEFSSMSNDDIIALTTEWETKGDSGEYYLTSEYIYVCYPASRGTCSSFSIGGFGSDTWPLDVRNVTNSSGYVEMYNIYHSINKTSGNTAYDIH